MDTLIPFLADVAIRSTLILAVSLGVIASMRSASAAQRHLVLTGGLFLTACLPAAMLGGLKIPWALPLPERVMTFTAPLRMAPVPNVKDFSLSPPSAETPLPAASFTTLPDMVAAFLGIGMLAQLASLGRAANRWRSIVARAADFDPSSRAMPMLVRDSVLPVLVSPEISIPLLYGWRKPVILLPAGADAWKPERLALVLRHEMAHFQRGDHWLLLLFGALRVLYWWHPLLWVALKRIERERENACDDRVLASDVRPSEYAHLVVETARGAATGRHHHLAVAMASTPRLRGRVEAILHPALNRRQAGKTTTALVLLLAAALLPLLGARLAPAEVPVALIPSSSAKGIQVRLRFEKIAVSDATYLAQPDRINRALQDQDLGYFNKLAGVSMISTTVTTKPGVRATIDLTNPMTFPTTYHRGPDGKTVPSDFRTRKVGLQIEERPSLTPDRKYVDLHLTCADTEFLGWDHSGNGPQAILYSRRVETSPFLVGPKGHYLWLDAYPPPTHPGKGSSPDDHQWEALLVQATLIPDHPQTSSPPASSQHAISLVFRFVEVDEKAYHAQAQTMDAAVRAGDLSLLQRQPGADLLRAATVVLPPNQRGWISFGEVMSYVSSVKQEARAGEPVTTLSQSAVFLGLNGDLTPRLSADGRITLNSTWQVSEPIRFTKAFSVFDLPPGGQSVFGAPVLHLVNASDHAEIEPGREHGLWLGDLAGPGVYWLGHGNPAAGADGSDSAEARKAQPLQSLRQVMQSPRPVRLAVFVSGHVLP